MYVRIHKKCYTCTFHILQAFEAEKDSLPDWLMFDDTLATFSGVPMESDVGNVFIEVNVLDNDRLILDDIFPSK